MIREWASLGIFLYNHLRVLYVMQCVKPSTFLYMQELLSSLWHIVCCGLWQWFAFDKQLLRKCFVSPRLLVRVIQAKGN